MKRATGIIPNTRRAPRAARPRAFALVCALGFLVLAGRVAWAQDATKAGSTRGIAGAVEIQYPHKLRAKPGQTPASPVLVRVLSGSRDGLQRVEFIGAVSGTYDLREYVERADNEPAADLPDMTVRVVSQLPPEHGLDLFGQPEAEFNLHAHYREILIAAAGLWVLVPVYFVVRRLARRAPAVVAVVPPRGRTLVDDLRDMLDAAARGPMSVAERGRLELLLLRYYRETASGGGDADLKHAVQGLRAQESTREIVLAVERWLHGPSGGGDRPGPVETGVLSSVRAALPVSSALPAAEAAP